MFIPQSQLESWIGAGEGTFENNMLTVPGRGTFELQPAARIVALIDGADSKGWVGQILTLAQIEEDGGEHFQGTVIVGDTGYECEDGFLGTSRGARPPEQGDACGAADIAATSEPNIEPAAADEVASPCTGAPSGEEAASSDVDMLADFLLKNLD